MLRLILDAPLMREKKKKKKKKKKAQVNGPWSFVAHRTSPGDTPARAAMQAMDSPSRPLDVMSREVGQSGNPSGGLPRPPRPPRRRQGSRPRRPLPHDGAAEARRTGEPLPPRPAGPRRGPAPPLVSSRRPTPGRTTTPPPVGLPGASGTSSTPSTAPRPPMTADPRTADDAGLCGLTPLAPRILAIRGATAVFSSLKAQASRQA